MKRFGCLFYSSGASGATVEVSHILIARGRNIAENQIRETDISSLHFVCCFAFFDFSDRRCISSLLQRPRAGEQVNVNIVEGTIDVPQRGVDTCRGSSSVCRPAQRRTKANGAVFCELSKLAHERRARHADLSLRDRTSTASAAVRHLPAR